VLVEAFKRYKIYVKSKDIVKLVSIRTIRFYKILALQTLKSLKSMNERKALI
jgi:hypothetical protein